MKEVGKEVKERKGTDRREREREGRERKEGGKK